MQILNAVNYCHSAKIIHRDLKFANVMLKNPPEYNEQSLLDISSVDIKVVDFGIFGSISGIRMENVNAGSLKYMAPELIQGHIESTVQIDIWSIGIMLHAMVIGWLPFYKQDREELKKQICEQQLDYFRLKRVKTTTIKDENRKLLHMRLRKLSDECIDLIVKMLEKDPNKRIEMIDIFEHPWINMHMDQLNQIDESSDDITDSDEEYSEIFTPNNLKISSKNEKSSNPSMFDIAQKENETSQNNLDNDTKQQLKEC